MNPLTHHVRYDDETDEWQLVDNETHEVLRSCGVRESLLEDNEIEVPFTLEDTVSGKAPPKHCCQDW